MGEAACVPCTLYLRTFRYEGNKYHNKYDISYNSYELPYFIYFLYVQYHNNYSIYSSTRVYFRTFEGTRVHM